MSKSEAEAVKAWMESLDYNCPDETLTGNSVWGNGKNSAILHSEATFFYKVVKQAELDARIDTLQSLQRIHHEGDIDASGQGLFDFVGEQIEKYKTELQRLKGGVA